MENTSTTQNLNTNNFSKYCNIMKTSIPRTPTTDTVNDVLLGAISLSTDPVMSAKQHGSGRPP